MNDLIKTHENENGELEVSGRELHDFLEVGTKYPDWFKRMCDYGFIEGIDYQSCFSNLGSEIHGGQNKVDHQMTINMAKELCMLQRTDKGKQARQYFLQLEQAWNTPETVMARALKLADRTIHSLKVDNEKLTVQNTLMLPKAVFADSVATSKTTILVGELAKILKQNGIDTGQNRLFAWLRENGYLISRKGTDYNMPTQKAMELELFEIKETSITHADGHITVNKTPKVTGKG